MYKTVIVVWSEEKPSDELHEISDECHDGNYFCASVKSKKVRDLADDLDLTDEVIEFFDLDDDSLDEDSDEAEAEVDIDD